MTKVNVFMTVLMCASLLFVSGCKTLPTPETMETTSYAIGVSTGLVANMTKIDDDSRNAICDIMGAVATVIPEDGQTFEDAWMDVAKRHTQALIDKGTITQAQGELILAAVRLAVKGIDYVFIRYPEAKQYKELVTAATRGFCNGFLTVFKPVNGEKVSCTAMCPCSSNAEMVKVGGVWIPYDEAAYKYLLIQAR